MSPRDYSQVKYYIDNIGRMWKGPICPTETLHYATFEGVVNKYPYDQCWVLQSTDLPNNIGAEEITFERACLIIKRYGEEARSL